MYCLAGQTEFQQLMPDELKACTDAARPGSARVREMNPAVMRSLYKRGLLYFDVPIWPDDHVSIPPLEVCCTTPLTKCSLATGDHLLQVLALLSWKSLS